MLPDVFFPSSVMLLKFLYRLYVSNQPKPMDVVRAICSFPVDLGFLSLSFFAAFVYGVPSERLAMFSSKDTLGGFVFLLVLSTVITVLCRVTDRAIIENKYIISGFLTVVAYAMSLALLFVTLEVGAALK